MTLQKIQTQNPGEPEMTLQDIKNILVNRSYSQNQSNYQPLPDYDEVEAEILQYVWNNRPDGGSGLYDAFEIAGNLNFHEKGIRKNILNYRTAWMGLDSLEEKGYLKSRYLGGFEGERYFEETWMSKELESLLDKASPDTE